MAVKPTRTIKIFYCYAHEDDALREQLARHLSPLQRLRYITAWFDRDIQAGTDWEHEIETHLDAASLILLLVSADFIYSNYCYSVEMQRALDRHKSGTARVIPIILRPVHWEETSIGTLQVLPTNKKPVTQWADRDEAWLDVVQGIREVVRTLLPKQILSPHETSILYPDQIDRLVQHPAVLPLQITPNPPPSSPAPIPTPDPGNGLICPKCGFENRPGSKFCMQDGQMLTPSAVYKPTPSLPQVQLQGHSTQPASPALFVTQIAPSLPASSPSSVSVTAPSRSLRKALGDLPNQSLKTLTKPSPTAFETEASKARWGIVWIQLVSSPVLVGAFLTLVGLLLSFVPSLPAVLKSYWWNLPLVGVSVNLALLLLSFSSLGITYLIAKVFGGRGTFLSQIYTMYLFKVPALIASTLIITSISYLPYFIYFITSINNLPYSPYLPYLSIIIPGLLLLMVFCYNILLSIFSIMAIHQLNGGRATVVILISVLVMLVLLALLWVIVRI